MARYSVKITKASGAAAAWHSGLRCPATADARVWEVHVFAETAAAGTLELRRITTAGVTPTSTTPVAEDPQSVAATVLVDTAFVTVPASTAVPFRAYALPATLGQGIIWTFPQGLILPTSGAIGLFQTSVLAVTYGVTFVFDQ